METTPPTEGLVGPACVCGHIEYSHMILGDRECRAVDPGNVECDCPSYLPPVRVSIRGQAILEYLRDCEHASPRLIGEAVYRQGQGTSRAKRSWVLPAVHALERKGLVRRQAVNASDGGYIFHITERGRRIIA